MIVQVIDFQATYSVVHADEAWAYCYIYFQATYSVVHFRAWKIFQKMGLPSYLFGSSPNIVKNILNSILPSYLFGSSRIKIISILITYLPSYLFGSSQRDRLYCTKESLPSYLFGSSPLHLYFLGL